MACGENLPFLWAGCVGLALGWLNCQLILISMLFVIHLVTTCWVISTRTCCSVWVTNGRKGKFKAQKKTLIKMSKTLPFQILELQNRLHTEAQHVAFRKKIPRCVHCYLRPIACFPFVTACVILTLLLVSWPGGCITLSLRICARHCSFLDPFATVC